MSKLDELMKDINKKFGSVLTEGQIETKYEKIPFTAPRLNYMTYGGLVEGRFHMFAGSEGSGKTLTALDVCKNAMKKYPDKKVFYADLEQTLDPVWGLKNGVDINKFIIFRPDVCETEMVLDTLVQAINTGECSLVVLDSIPVMVSSQIMEDSVGQNKYGGNAQAIARFCNKVAGTIRKYNTTVLFINQVRDDLSSPYGGTITPGGKALKFALSTWLELRKGKFIDADGKELTNSAENPAGNLVNIVLKKSKVCVSDRRLGYYTLNYVHGIDTVADYIDIGLQVGVINQKGSFFDIIDPSTGEVLNQDKIQGKSKLKEQLSEHKEWLDLIDSQLQDKEIEELIEKSKLDEVNMIINNSKETD